KEISRRAGRCGIKRRVNVALMPSAPESQVNKPVRSGPKWRKNGLPFCCAADPVDSTEPFASTTSILSTESAEAPNSPAPQYTLFWDTLPPTVAWIPDNGPQ